MPYVEHKPAKIETKPAPPPNKPNPHYISSTSCLGICEKIDPEIISVPVKLIISSGIFKDETYTERLLAKALAKEIIKEHLVCSIARNMDDGFVEILAEIKVVKER